MISAFFVYARFQQIQIFCSNDGMPIYFSGPHDGAQSDIAIFRENPLPDMDDEADERTMADRAYCGADGTTYVYQLKYMHSIQGL